MHWEVSMWDTTLVQSGIQFKHFHKESRMLSSFLLLRKIFPVEIKIPTYNSRRSPHVLGTGKAYIRVEFNVLLQRSLEILLGVIRPSPAIKCPVPITSTRLYQCSSPSIPDSWEYIKLPQVDFPKSWLQRTQPSLWTVVSSTELQASVFLGYSKNGVQCLHPGTRDWPRGTCNRRFPFSAGGLPALAVCPFMETTQHSPQQLWQLSRGATRRGLPGWRSLLCMNEQGRPHSVLFQPAESHVTVSSELCLIPFSDFL